MKPTTRRATRFAPLLAAALAALLGCADLKALSSLVSALQSEYHVPVNVSVNNDRNGSHLVLLFARFPDAKLGPDEREAFARDVARFARAHYAGAAHLQDISIGTVQQSGAGPVTFTKREVPYHFTTAELDDGTPSDTTRPDSARASDGTRR